MQAEGGSEGERDGESDGRASGEISGMMEECDRRLLRQKEIKITLSSALKVLAQTCRGLQKCSQTQGSAEAGPNGQ